MGTAYLARQMDQHNIEYRAPHSLYTKGNFSFERVLGYR